MKNPYITLEDYYFRIYVDVLFELQEWNELGEVLCDSDFIEAIVVVRTNETNLGVDLLLQIYDLAESSFPQENEWFHKTRRTRQLIRREAHNLRNKQLIKQQESYILQQIYNRATEMGESHLVQKTLTQLQERKLSHLNLQWRSRSESTSLELTLSGHSSVVMSVAITANGKTAVSGSFSDQTVRLWDLENGRNTHTFTDHSDTISKVILSPIAPIAFSASRAGEIAAWNLVDGQREWFNVGHEDYINDVLITPNGERIITASNDGCIKVWDVNTGELINSMQNYKKFMWWKLCLIPQSNFLASISPSDGSPLIIWDIETGQPVLSLEGHEFGIMGLAVTTDGKRIVTISFDDTIRVWNLNTAKEDLVLSWDSGDHDDIDPPALVAIMPDNKTAISTADDRGRLKTWNLTTGSEIFVSDNQWGTITDLKVLNEQYFIFSTTDFGIRICNAYTGEIKKAIHGHSAQINVMALSRNTKRLITGDGDGLIKVWDLPSLLNESQIEATKGHNHEVIKITITPDGNQALSVSDFDGVKVWNISTGHQEEHLKIDGVWEEDGFIQDLNVTENGQVILSTGYRLTIWDAFKNNTKWRLGLPSFGVPRIALGQKRAVIYSMEPVEGLHVWDIETRKLEYILKRSISIPNHLHVTPDDKWLISESRDELIKVYNLEDKSIIWTSPRHEGFNSALTIDKMGEFVAGVTSLWGQRVDDFIRVWKANPNFEEPFLEIHHQDIKSISTHVSLNFGYAVTKSSSDLVVWDLKTGRRKTILTDSTWIRHVAPLDHDKVIFDDDEYIKIWNIKKEKKECVLGQHQSVSELLVEANGKYALTLSRELIPEQSKQSVYSVKVWDLVKVQEIADFKTEEFGLPLALISNGKEAVCLKDGGIVVWNLKSKTIQEKLEQSALSLAVPPNAEKVFFATDNDIKVWHRNSGLIEDLIESKLTNIGRIVFSDDCRYAVVSSSIPIMQVWDLKNGQLAYELLMQDYDCNEIGALTPDGKSVFLTSVNGNSKLLDIESGELTHEYDGEMAEISSNGDQLALNNGNSLILQNRLSGDMTEVIKESDRQSGHLWSDSPHKGALTIMNLNAQEQTLTTILDGKVKCANIVPKDDVILVGDATGNIYCFKYVCYPDF